MAFTRGFLSSEGIEGETQTKIMAAHVEVTNYYKEKVSELEDKISELKTKVAKSEELKTKLDEANKKLSDTEKSLNEANAESEKYKGMYETEKIAKEKLESDNATRETVAKKESALKSVLKEKKYSDEATKLIISKGGYTDKIELDDSGKLKNADSILGEIQNDFSMFTPKELYSGTNPATPPANSGGSKKPTKEEIMKIKDAGERQLAIAKNMDLFSTS